MVDPNLRGPDLRQLRPYRPRKKEPLILEGLYPWEGIEQAIIEHQQKYNGIPNLNSTQEDF